MHTSPNRGLQHHTVEQVPLRAQHIRAVVFAKLRLLNHLLESHVPCNGRRGFRSLTMGR